MSQSKQEMAFSKVLEEDDYGAREVLSGFNMDELKELAEIASALCTLCIEITHERGDWSGW